MKKKSSLSTLLGIFLVVAGLGIFSLRFLAPKTIAIPSSFANEANHYLSTSGQDMTLLLQTDPAWGQTPYGSGSETNDLATNGCAITSLAMVLSYYQKRTVLPTEILEWSQDRYYVEGSGTAWSIFPDFADRYQLSCQDLGLDASQIQDRLNQNQPIILSVKPGEFTTIGHIMVIKKDLTSDQIIVYDPNDSPEKEHFKTRYALEPLLAQSVHAWSFAPI
ncbi:hypothetical protein NRIC_01620 [Enterococcus florum]|uniref:Peptidase C39-like domain-containing protein n=1 Tax=Enterococcus florum TaxID=2480627 RepID=A0A4P5P7T7_9ENTE|nr:C39 family peptidase [Enterococcus florum]GCF92271.1 hypothetical protein NRIC_01620 [Enterococcus florum]